MVNHLPPTRKDVFHIGNALDFLLQVGWNIKTSPISYSHRILSGARSLFPNSQTSFILLSSLPGLSRADNDTISTTPRPTQPNVLFIVADDLGNVY